MIGELWKSLVGYLQQQPYWNRLQPVLLLLLFYVGTAVTAYQYVQWQYGLAPAPPEFIGSYLFKQITVAYSTLAGILLALHFTGVAAGEAPSHERWRDWLRRSWPRLLRPIIAVALILVVAAYAWVRLNPSRFAPTVRIKFDPPERSLRQLSFDPIAFTYLMYNGSRSLI